MSYRLLISSLLTLSVLGLAACREETTQPNTALDQPTIPQLAAASNTWLTRRDMPLDRRGLSAAVVPNAAGQSILYAIGGATPTGSTLGEVRAYNVATNTWTSRPDMPAALWGMNGAGVIKGKIYVSGGLPFDWTKPSKGPRKSLLVYDPGANVWTRKRDMPEVGGLGVTGVIKGKLYVISDCFELGSSHLQWGQCWAIPDGRPAMTNFFGYDPATDNWVRLPSPKRAFYQSGGVIDGKFYVVGPAVEAYDPSTNEWTTMPSTPPPAFRFGAPTVAALGGKLWVAGLDNIDSHVVPSMWIYDPVSETWTSRPTPGTDVRDAYTIKVFLNGQPRIEAVGGSRPGNNLQYIP